MKDVRRALCLVWQADPVLVVAQAITMVFQGLLPLVGLYLMKLIVDALAEAPLMSSSAADSRIPFLIVAAGATALAVAVFKEAGAIVQEAQSQKLSDHVYGRLHRQSINLDLAYFENPDHVDTLHRAQAEGPYRPGRILDSIIQLGQGMVSLLGIGGLLFVFHWSVPLLLAAAVLPSVWVKWRFAAKLFQWQSDSTRLERRSGYYHWLLTAAETAKEIRLLNLGGLFLKRFRRDRAVIRKTRLNLSRKRGNAATAAQGGAVLITFACFGMMALRTLHGLFTIGDFVMFVQSFYKGFGSLQTVLSAGAELNENRLFLTHLYRFLDLRPSVTPPEVPMIIPAAFQEKISCHDLSFSYPGSNRMVLSDVFFSILPGEVVALVGQNGSGKTTLAKLLCRLYDPDHGHIEIDGIDIRHFDPGAWRNQIGIVSQDYLRFHATVDENIRFGDLKGAGKNGRVLAAAQKTGAHDFITELPQGYNTPLGKQLATGSELSQGQWQKIALSRAFLKTAQLMILDEPTSALDADTEFQIFSLFRKLVAGQSALIISHRFSTVRMADRIVVLENGKIIETGSHNDLIASQGRYAEMFEKQVGMYG